MKRNNQLYKITLFLSFMILSALFVFSLEKSFANSTCPISLDGSNADSASSCSKPTVDITKSVTSPLSPIPEQTKTKNSEIADLKNKIFVPKDAPKVLLEMFYSYDCPHCHEALQWLPEVQSAFPNLMVKTYEVKKDKDNRELFIKTAKDNKVEITGVPTFFIGGKAFVGFYKEQTCCLLIDEIKELTFGKAQINMKRASKEIKVPILGTMHIDQISLFNFSIVIGLLDGLNPCAMWVLMFLLGLLVYTRSQKRVIMIGSIFVISSGVVYFAFMSAWFNLFYLIGSVQYLRYILALVAIIMGLINLKELFFFKQGVSLMIPESAKPKIAKRIRTIMQEKSVGAAVFGTILLAVFVNLIELGCTIGLPAIFTKILVDREVSISSKYFYMIIYNIAYIIPLAILVGLFAFTLGHYKMSERHGKILKLISGLLMTLLGIILLTNPGLLTIS